MSINTTAVPDYELADKIELNTAAQLRALADPIRSMILDLLLERAATVTELASAIGRPKSTVAHHVAVLVDVGMLKVVRTRRVRAIEERYYGRTARLFMVGVVFTPGDPALAVHANNLSVSAANPCSRTRRTPCAASSVTRVSRPSAQGSSGARWRCSCASSAPCRAKATRSTASPSASTRRSIPRCRNGRPMIRTPTRSSGLFSPVTMDAYVGKPTSKRTVGLRRPPTLRRRDRRALDSWATCASTTPIRSRSWPTRPRLR